VKENPEPIIFKLISYGVKPELELDKKILQFDKVLLHRLVTFLNNCITPSLHHMQYNNIATSTSPYAVQYNILLGNIIEIR
jgi:hypothetical protein